jgi:hypothetical protein
MKTYEYIEAQCNFEKILRTAQSDDVLIKRQKMLVADASPFDVTAPQTQATRHQIICAVRAGRQDNDF